MRCKWPVAILAVVASAGAAGAPLADPLAPVDDTLVVVHAPQRGPTKPDILGTVALRAGVTGYDVRWRRVSAADQSDARVVAMAAIAQAAGTDRAQRIASVQAQVKRKVRWSHDLDNYRVADYWAGAGETLTRGAGDSEDIAILKLQVLKAAGFPSHDLYLSVGRDRRRGADTLLVVHADGRFYALDDREMRALPTASDARFEPVITLGRDQAWVHGRRIVGIR